VDSNADLMRRAAAVAARVLADLWPDGRAVVSIDDLGPLHFVVSAEHDGVRVKRTGEVMDAYLWDVIHLGQSRPAALPPGAHVDPEGRVSVELPRRRFRRRPRPVHWAEGEVEQLCRLLNEIDSVVIGA
jgi:hypothetical protein